MNVRRNRLTNARSWRDTFLGERRWKKRGFAAPAPQNVKEAVLARHSPKHAIWVETGTFRGSTTSFLATIAKQVYSIEPEPALYNAAVKRFAKEPRVVLVHGQSEDCLPTIVARLSGNVAFWLDGHFSHGDTFKGKTDTPIIAELATIGGALSSFQSVSVLVDDVRLFGVDPAYPPLSFLVSWAEKHHLRWTIEHDIFVATTRLDPDNSVSHE